MPKWAPAGCISRSVTRLLVSKSKINLNSADTVVRTAYGRHDTWAAGWNPDGVNLFVCCEVRSSMRAGSCPNSPSAFLNMKWKTLQLTGDSYAHSW
jgi:hypothetical protein